MKNAKTASPPLLVDQDEYFVKLNHDEHSYVIGNKSCQLKYLLKIVTTYNILVTWVIVLTKILNLHFPSIQLL